MEYFLLKPFTGGCRLKLIERSSDLIICKQTKKGELPDFTLQPEPLISDRFKILLEQYMPFMEFTPCILEGEGEPVLWAPGFKDLEAEKALFLPEGTVKAVPCLGVLPIIRVSNYKKVSYVINLALAESLLRRGYVNLELERIETLGGDTI